MRKIIVGLLVGLFSIAALAEDASYDWQLARDRDGIQIYKAEVAGSDIKAIKGEMIAKLDLETLVDLLSDPAKRAQWDANVGETRVVEQVSDSEALVYLHMKLPFPVKDRDMVSRVVWANEGRATTMRATAVDGGVEPQRKRVRVTQGFNNWQLVQMADGAIKVTTIAHLDPAGPIPGWLINMLSVDAPFDSLKNLRALSAVQD